MKKQITFLLLFISITSFAQLFEVNNITKSDLLEKSYPLDSTATAAILYQERKITFPDYKIHDFYYKRIKIYKKAGFDYATVEIPYYVSSKGKELIASIKAYTYTLVDGKIVKTALAKKQIFTKQISKFYKAKIFTFPNIKEGSIITYSYTLLSPYLQRLDDVELQDYIPIKKEIISFRVPEGLAYRSILKGFLPIENNEDGKITLENIPAIKDEPYAGNIDNYKASIVYELASVEFPNYYKNYSTTWDAVGKKLLLDSKFGYQLKKNKFQEEDLTTFLKNTATDEDKMLKVFALIKQKIKWNKKNGIYSSGIKDAYKKGEGNVADVNLALTVMLRNAGLDANPVLVSTVDHGIPLYPTIAGFNYVIVMVKTNQGAYLLDATSKNSFPNVLPSRVLNFQGRALKKDGTSFWVNLYPNEFSKKETSLMAKFTLDGFNGFSRTSLDNNIQLSYRNRLQGKDKDALISWFEDNHPNVDLSDIRINNLDNLEKNCNQLVKFTTTSFYEELGGKIFIDPLLYLKRTENPFKAKTREFPIFYDYPWYKSNTVSITIPKGYHIVSVPKETKYELPDELGGFAYKVIQKGNVITTKSIVNINKGVVAKRYYQDLKKLYTAIINKHDEKIVVAKD